MKSSVFKDLVWHASLVVVTLMIGVGCETSASASVIPTESPNDLALYELGDTPPFEESPMIDPTPVQSGIDVAVDDVAPLASLDSEPAAASHKSTGGRLLLRRRSGAI